MNGKYAVSIGGNIVVWKDGKFSSDNKDLERRIRAVEQRAKGQPFFKINLDGSLLYAGDWIKPSENWATSFGFLQDIMGGDLEFVTGDRPTWEKLGYEEKENEIY